MFDVDAFLAANWATEPFRHMVIDGLWNDDFLRDCRQEFPDYGDHRWITYNDPEEFGKKAGPASLWGTNTQRFFRQVRSPEFVLTIEHATGIDSLTADDIGGGMHMTGPGGRLEMHVDFNVHPDKALERRINMLVFLNDEWDCSWGGCLLLGGGKEISVEPVFNRTVLFECSDTSFHGHPDPIIDDHYRRSLACYFYAPLRAGVLERAHTTIWNR